MTWFHQTWILNLKVSRIFDQKYPLWFGLIIKKLRNKICEFFEIGETMPWKSSFFLFAPAPWATPLKPWIWWNIWIIWSCSYRVSSTNQNWSWLRIVSYQSWFVTTWSPKLSKKFLKRCKNGRIRIIVFHTCAFTLAS